MKLVIIPIFFQNFSSSKVHKDMNIERKTGNDSDASFGSTGSSLISNSATDPEALKMGTDNLKTLTIKMFGIQLLTTIFPQIQALVELTVLVKFLKVDIVQVYTLVYPLIMIVSFEIPTALAQATNTFVRQNLSKNQSLIANTYLAYYYLIGVLYAVIAFVLYFTVVKQFFGDPLLGIYMILKFASGALTNFLGRGPLEFLKFEARYLPILLRDAFESLGIIGLLINFYDENAFFKKDLTAAGFAFLIPSGLIAIWMIALMLKLNVLGTEYKGQLRFNIRRLSPIRPRFIVQILYNLVPQLLQSCGFWALILAAAIMANQSTELEYRMIGFMKIIAFVRTRGVVAAVSAAFTSVMQSLAAYNMAVKKVTRVFETLRYVSGYMVFVVVVVGAVFAAAGDALMRAVFRSETEDPELLEYYFAAVRLSTILGPLSAVFSMFYGMSVQFKLLENKLLIATLSQLPQYGCIVVMALVHNLYGDNMPYVEIFAFSEAIAGVVGLVDWIYVYICYSKLNKLNTQAMQKQEQLPAAAAKAEETTSTVRDSVMQMITAGEEQGKVKNRAQLNLATMFDKSIALRQSKIFVSMRDSIAGSNRNSTAVRTSEMFKVRASENEPGGQQ